MDLLQRASDWLESQRARWASRTVEYRRGIASVEVLATVGKTVFEQTNQWGVVERSEARDYLISAADLVLGGQAVVPQRGDQIRETDGSVTLVYEVMAPGQEPPWRYSDPYRKTLRIHTRQIDTETV